MEIILNSHDDGCPGDEGTLKKIIFLLTKPPRSERTKLCFRLIEGSKSNAVLYLAGDGVFNLLSRSIDVLPPDSIFACKEDMEARGIPCKDGVNACDNFYEKLVEDTMDERNGFYSF